MELDLSLGDASRPFGFTEKPREASNQLGLLGFNTILSIGPVITKQSDHQQQQKQEEETAKHKHKDNSHSTAELEDHEATNDEYSISPPSPLKANNNTLVQLDLLPHTPAIAPINPPPNLSFSWHPPWEYAGGSCLRGLDGHWLPAAVAVEDEAEFSSSPNSAASSFQLDLLIYSTRGGSVNGEGYDQRGCSSRASDEDENRRSTRKKLRLSKEQSTFLEESFKEHNTLNPKQKLALAKQLHLRPRQVEVWFQNRRARTKLKQTEVDYEYLKRCCETLQEENKRLHKELQELKALKTPNPFYTQLPATTLTMCPSCERVATNSTSIPSSVTTNTATATVKAINEQTSKAIGFSLSKPRFYPFLHTQPHPHQSTPS